MPLEAPPLARPLVLALAACASLILTRPAFAQTASSASAPPLPSLPPAPSSLGESAVGDEAFPSLGQALTRAREHAPPVVAGRAQLQAVRSGYVGARLSPVGNPYTEIVLERALTSVTKDVTLSATLWLPIELWGQRGARIDEVDARVGFSQAALEALRAQMMGEVVRSYGAAVVEAERVKTLELVVQGAKAERDLYRARVDAGDATEQDAALAALELSRNAVALAESKADLSRALFELSRVTGSPGYRPPDGVPPQPPPPPETQPAPERRAERSPVVGALQLESLMYQRVNERLSREAKLPFMLMLQGGRGDVGETRFGVGAALTFPVSRSNQGERAQAEADSARAQSEARAQQGSTATLLKGLEQERRQVHKASDEITASLEPAGQAALDAAVAMLKAGKGEMLRVLTARRDLIQLRTRRLELYRREWSIVAQIVSLTGESP